MAERKPPKEHFVEAYFVKRDRGFFPADEDSQAVFDRCGEWPNGAAIKIKLDVNVRQRNLFFKLIHVLVENTEFFETEEQARTIIKIACGEVDPIIRPDDGKTFMVVRSLKIEDWPADRFDRFFQRALHVVTERYLPMTPQALREEIYDLIDRPAQRSLGRRIR